MDGYVEQVYPDGSTFKGYFKQGVKEGKGHVLFKDGSWFKGDFVNDKMHVDYLI